MIDSKNQSEREKMIEIKKDFRFALEDNFLVKDFEIISENISMDGNIEIRYNLEINNRIRENIKESFNNKSDYEIWANYRNMNDSIIFRIDIKNH